MSDIPGPKPAPISEIIASRFLGPTFTNEQVLSIVPGALTRLPGNPNRVSWTMINEGANDVRVSNLPNVTASSGWLLAANGGFMSFDWAIDGEAVSYEIYLIANGAASNVRYREVIRS